MKISEMQIQEQQEAVCRKYGVDVTVASMEVMSGLALSTKGQLPVNGLRNPHTGKTTGWYIWFGEQFSVAPDFFAPICTSHIYEEHPEIAKFLGLPPGFRFLFVGDFWDVWYDKTLLDV